MGSRTEKNRRAGSRFFFSLCPKIVKNVFARSLVSRLLSKGRLLTPRIGPMKNSVVRRFLRGALGDD
jgi:hypothetical protein